MLVARGGEKGGFSSPRKYGTNWIMPAFVNNGAVGWVGMSEEDPTTVWSLAAQYSFHTWRSSAAVLTTTRFIGRYPA
jgi:hypothetical protein